MSKQTLLYILLAMSVNSIAQKDATLYRIEQAKLCGGIEIVLSKKGSWNKAENDIVFPDKTFPSSHYKLVEHRVDSIFLLLRKSIQRLDGLEAKSYYGIRGNAYIPNGPVPYSLNTYFLEYYCNGNVRQILLDDETFNKVAIYINHLNFFWDKVDDLDVNNDGKLKSIYQLPVRIGKWHDLNIYELRTNSTAYAANAVIIGRQDKIPWRSLTRRQYLVGLKGKWENALKKVTSGTGFERDYKGKLQHINDYLSRATEDDLQQPAIIDPREGIWGFKGKFGEEENKGFRLVLPVLSDKYFDINLPREVPQLIELYWSYSSAPAALALIDQFEKNFPLKRLAAMIDK